MGPASILPLLPSFHRCHQHRPPLCRPPASPLAPPPLLVSSDSPFSPESSLTSSLAPSPSLFHHQDHLPLQALSSGPSHACEWMGGESPSISYQKSKGSRYRPQVPRPSPGVAAGSGPNDLASVLLTYSAHSLSDVPAQPVPSGHAETGACSPGPVWRPRGGGSLCAGRRGQRGAVAQLCPPSV